MVDDFSPWTPSFYRIVCTTEFMCLVFKSLFRAATRLKYDFTKECGDQRLQNATNLQLRTYTEKTVRDSAYGGWRNFSHFFSQLPLNYYSIELLFEKTVNSFKKFSTFSTFSTYLMSPFGQRCPTLKNASAKPRNG